MRMPARYIGLIPSAGNGSRFGGDIPKQYQALNGRAVLSYAPGEGRLAQVSFSVKS